jgi:hypothetical protein
MQEPHPENTTAASLAAAQEQRELGEPIRVFAAGSGMRIGAAFCGCLLLGAAILWTVSEIPFSFHLWFLAAFAFLLAFMLGHESHVVCPGGVIIKRRRWPEQLCRWEDVSEVVDTRVKVGVGAQLEFLGFSPRAAAE